MSQYASVCRCVLLLFIFPICKSTCLAKNVCLVQPIKSLFWALVSLTLPIIFTPLSPFFFFLLLSPSPIIFSPLSISPLFLLLSPSPIIFSLRSFFFFSPALSFSLSALFVSIALFVSLSLAQLVYDYFFISLYPSSHSSYSWSLPL